MPKLKVPPHPPTHYTVPMIFNIILRGSPASGLGNALRVKPNPGQGQHFKI